MSVKDRDKLRRACGLAMWIAAVLALSGAALAQVSEMSPFDEQPADGEFQPLIACGAALAPACDGDCPPGTGCVPAAGGAGCFCVPETQPCGQCGAGPHFVDLCGPFPPLGTDLIAKNGAVVGIDTNFDCVRDINLVLTPCPSPNDLLRVDKKLGPVDDSAAFPGTRPVDGHMDVIDTEIVTMCLTSGGVTLAAGINGPSSFPLLRSLGAVAELPGFPPIADSFFDVFFEVSGVPGGPVYNKAPLYVSSQIKCLPPEANYSHPTGICIPLVTKGFCSNNPAIPCVYNSNCPAPGTCVGQQTLGNLVAANHSVNEPLCDEHAAPQCDAECPTGQVCVPNAATGCACQPIPCPQSPAPQCDAACPPGLSCQMGGPPPVGCKCLSNKCEQSPYPTCGGLCPPGSSCQPSTTGVAKCDCVPDKPCQSIAPHQCDGDCPNSDEICIPGPTDICGCFKLPCTSALAPACDADCPAPMVCRQVPGTTHCDCVNPTAQCDQTAPSCDGPCPNLADVCVHDAVGCHCEPPQPCDATYPTCDGFCPVGSGPCHNVPGTTTCTCNDQPQPCQGTFPACDGFCPAGSGPCHNVPGTTTCTCDGGPTPCEQSAPACDGFCPPTPDGTTQICVTEPAVGCFCEPVGQPCEQSFPACDGNCPPGSNGAPQTCVKNAVGECDCHPSVQLPCDATFPTCSGFCPPDQACFINDMVDPPKCECKPIQPPPCEQDVFPGCDGACTNPLRTCVPNQFTGKCVCGCKIPPPPPPGLAWASKSKMKWLPPWDVVRCPLIYHVYKHNGVLVDSDHNGVADEYGSCYATVQETEMDDTSIPPSGQLALYVVSAESENGESSLGQASNGLPRPNVTPCP